MNKIVTQYTTFLFNLLSFHRNQLLLICINYFVRFEPPKYVFLTQAADININSVFFMTFCTTL